MSDPVAPLLGGVLKPRAFVSARDSQTCHAFGVCVCLREVRPDPMGVGSSKGSAWSNRARGVKGESDRCSRPCMCVARGS
eukprot:3795543-Amphidinium_carterae.1